MISALVHKVHTHEHANSLPYTDEADIEDKVCRDAIAWGMAKSCYDPAKEEIVKSRLRQIGQYLAGAFNIVNRTRAITGIRMLAGWLKSGEYASPDEAEKRAAVCVMCDRNVDVDCAQCQVTAIAMKILKVVGQRKTLVDDRLKHCAECGCSNRIKVWVPMTVIKEKTPVEAMERLPAHCWMKL